MQPAPRRAPSGRLLAIGIGGGVLLLAAVGVGIGALLGPGRPDTKEGVVAGAPTVPSGETAGDSADKPDDTDPPADRGGRGPLSSQALRHLKGATVFIKVDAGPASCSGSGFLCKVDGDAGYVITNHHVVNPEAERLETLRIRTGRGIIYTTRVVRFKPSTAAISTVFHSGTRTEQVVRAELLSTDNSRDLAVLRVKGIQKWPQPIRLDQTVELVETMPVYILGFPFGDKLALKAGNPAITINKGSVSSLREDDYGHMKSVQIDGALNPGNSGGPVVDEKGRLIGIAVATIRGSGIGLAIAPDELTRMFQGRVGAVGLAPRKVDASVAEYDVTMQLIDPMGEIKSASILFKGAAVEPPRTNPGPQGLFSPLTDAERLDLKITNQEATGTLTLDRTRGDFKFLVVQTSYVNGSGKTIYTQEGTRRLESSGPPVVLVGPTSKPTTPSNGDLGGATATLGEVSLQEVKVNAAQVARKPLWSPDGKFFYALEKDKGTLHKIASDGLQEAVKVELETPCSSMAMSGEGIVVAANAIQQLYLVDPASLKVVRSMAAPRVVFVATAPTLSVAFAAAQPGSPGGEVINVLDLKTGEIVRKYNGASWPPNGVGFKDATATADGKYLFTWSGSEQMHRFKIDGASLVFEQSSGRIAQGGVVLEVSPDGKWVALPSGGGNYGTEKPYSTFIYSVTDLSSPVFTIESAGTRALGFDPKQGYVYANSGPNQFTISTMKALKLKEVEIKGAGGPKQFVAHPEGGSLLLLTDNKLFYVVLQKLTGTKLPPETAPATKPPTETSAAAKPPPENTAATKLQPGDFISLPRAAASPVSAPEGIPAAGLRLVVESGDVAALSFRPDGKLLAASGGEGKAAALWHLPAGQPSGGELDGTAAATVIAWSPAGKGLAAAVVDRPQQVVLCDAVGRVRTSLDVSDKTPTRELLFSPDGRWLARLGAKNGQVWEVASGKEMTAFAAPERWVKVCAAFAPGGLLAFGSVDVRLWDLEAGREVGRIDLARAGLRALAFSPDGRTLAIASTMGRRLYDVAARKETSFLDGLIDEPLAFSPESKFLAAVGPAGDLKVWERATGELRAELDPRVRQNHRITAVAFSPDGQLLVAGLDGLVRVWDCKAVIERAPYAPANDRARFLLQGPTNDVSAVAFSPDGQMLAGANSGGNIKVFDTTTGKELRALYAPGGFVHDLAFAPDSKRLAAAIGAAAHCWALPGGEELKVPTPQGKQDFMSRVCFSSDGKWLVGLNGRLLVWDLSAGREVGNHAVKRLSPMSPMGGALALSPDGQSATVLASDGLC
jgi:WD40 repeat protein